MTIEKEQAAQPGAAADKSFILNHFACHKSSGL